MAENNNNENLNEVERPTIAELKVRATGIKEETSAGANTAERVGRLMYDMIDVLDANMEQMAGDTLKEPLKTINAANLGIPDNNKFLAYKNNVWTYVDLSTIVSSVDWSNITNKPDLNNLPYLANSTPYGAGLSCSDGAIYLKDQNGNVLAYADISSGGGGGGSDAYAVRYIPSGQNAGNVKLPVNSQGDYKKGNLWANSIIIGSADTIYGSIAKSAATNDIIFDNNLNGGIFEFDKSIATTSSKIILGNRSPKKVEISIPSGSGITDKLDINTFTYVTDTGYTQDTGGSIYLNGVAIGSGGGGGGGLTPGSWAAFFDLNTKDSGYTTGYLHLNNNGISLESGTSGLTSAVTRINALNYNGQQVGQVPITPTIGPVSLKAGLGITLSVSQNTDTITIDATGGGGVSKLKVGNTDVLPDSNGAITFAGSGVSASGSTITITGGGGGWTPSQGGSQITSDDIAPNAVITAKINAKAVTGAKIDDQAVSRTKVNNTVITKTSLSNLCTKLGNAFNVIIAVQESSNGIDNKFWVAKEIQGSLSDSTFFFYKGTLSDTGRTCTNLIFEYQTNNNQIRPIKGSTYNEPLCFNTSTGPYEDQYAEITTSMVNTVCSVLSSSYSITVTAGSELTVSSTPDVTEFCQ